ncbi:MAG: hypothetical protein HY287_12525 [Planctomycetes bacterium]|nr:hypothetical protein [Planctomycetota bacterium]MBI3835147.1 hypothetical protein [Planctomycetota bacterium]
MRLTDLNPAPYSPRVISEEATKALKTSLGEFGDISGIVWNKRSGHLVAGHQRFEALKQKHGKKLSLKGGEIVTPTGERFAVRVVDWPDVKEKAANLAANSPFLAGSFDPGGLEAVLADLNAADGLGTLLDDIRLEELLPGAGDLLPDTGETGDEVAKTERSADDDVPAGPTEWITFSTPLTTAQHQIVMQAIRLARQNGCEKVSDGLHQIASAYLKEQSNG